MNDEMASHIEILRDAKAKGVWRTFSPFRRSRLYTRCTTWRAASWRRRQLFDRLCRRPESGFFRRWKLRSHVRYTYAVNGGAFSEQTDRFEGSFVAKPFDARRFAAIVHFARHLKNRNEYRNPRCEKRIYTHIEDAKITNFYKTREKRTSWIVINMINFGKMIKTSRVKII